jgi:Flp pilus assembly protein TadD
MVQPYHDFPEMPPASEHPPIPAPTAPARPTRPERSTAVLAAVTVACAVAIGFRNSLGAGFVFDDLVRITGSERHLDSFTRALGDQRPLTQLTLVLNWRLGGLDPWGYHLFNVVAHAMTAAMVMLAVREGGRRLRERGAIGLGERATLAVATAISLLWAMHPLQTAAVTYVIQRAEVLAGLGTVAAAFALLRAAGTTGAAATRWGVASAIATAMALLAKPTAVSAPAVLLALDAFVIAGSLRAALARRWALHAAIWMTPLVLLATGAVRALVSDGGRMTGAGLGVTGASPLEYLALQPRAIGLYLELVAFPAGLSIDHGAEALADGRLAVVGGVAIAACLAAAAVAFIRGRWWGFPPAAFLLLLAPTSSVVPLADPAADHRMYLPLAAIAIVAVATVAGLVRRASPPVVAPATVAAALAAATLLALEARATATRNLAYADPASLWSDVVARRPDSVRALVNRAGLSLDAGRLDEAERDLATAAALEPGHPSLILNLALLDLHRGRPGPALERLAIVERTLTFNPSVHAARGDALRSLGRHAEAAEAFALAGRRNPHDPLWPILEGNALTDDGRHGEAAESFSRAAELADDPHIRASALFNLGNARFRQSRFVEAADAYRAALEARPDHPEAPDWLDEATREAQSGAEGP